MLNDVIAESDFVAHWNDVKGYKCDPPLLDCSMNDKDMATQSILKGIRY